VTELSVDQVRALRELQRKAEHIASLPWDVIPGVGIGHKDCDSDCVGAMNRDELDEFVVAAVNVVAQLAAEWERLKEIEEAARLVNLSYPLKNDGPQSDIDYYVRKLRELLAVSSSAPSTPEDA
jgi:hypothetical protein